MNLLDIIILILLAGFVLYGVWLGFVHELGSLIGAIFATIIAGYFYVQVGDWLTKIFGNPVLMKIIAFLIIFFIVSKLFGFLFYYISKLLNVVTHLPFIHAIDRLMGGVLGFFEGVLVIGLTLFILTKYPLNPSLTALLSGAKLVPWFIAVSSVLQGFLPDTIKELQPQVKY